MRSKGEKKPPFFLFHWEILRFPRPSTLTPPQDWTGPSSIFNPFTDLQDGGSRDWAVLVILRRGGRSLLLLSLAGTPASLSPRPALIDSFPASPLCLARRRLASAWKEAGRGVERARGAAAAGRDGSEIIFYFFVSERGRRGEGGRGGEAQSRSTKRERESFRASARSFGGPARSDVVAVTRAGQEEQPPPPPPAGQLGTRRAGREDEAPERRLQQTPAAAEAEPHHGGHLRQVGPHLARPARPVSGAQEPPGPGRRVPLRRGGPGRFPRACRRRPPPPPAPQLPSGPRGSPQTQPEPFQRPGGCLDGAPGAASPTRRASLPGRRLQKRRGALPIIPSRPGGSFRRPQSPPAALRAS